LSCEADLPQLFEYDLVIRTDSQLVYIQRPN